MTVSLPVAPSGRIAFPPFDSSRALSTLRSTKRTDWTLYPRLLSSAATAPLLMAPGNSSNSLGEGMGNGLTLKEVTRALQASSGGGGGGFFGGGSGARRERFLLPLAGAAAAAAGAAAGAAPVAPTAPAAGAGLGAGPLSISEQGPNLTTLKGEKSSTEVFFSLPREQKRKKK